MSVEIVWIPYLEPGEVTHLGIGYSKEECLKLIGDGVFDHSGIYEYIVRDENLTRFASSADRVGIEKTLNRIFGASF